MSTYQNYVATNSKRSCTGTWQRAGEGREAAFEGGAEQSERKEQKLASSALADPLQLAADAKRLFGKVA
jgi:hypothetical protein